jgi:hypothetical protein
VEFQETAGVQKPNDWNVSRFVHNYVAPHGNRISIWILIFRWAGQSADEFSV